MSVRQGIALRNGIEWRSWRRKMSLGPQQEKTVPRYSVKLQEFYKEFRVAALDVREGMFYYIKKLMFEDLLRTRRR